MDIHDKIETTTNASTDAFTTARYQVLKAFKGLYIFKDILSQKEYSYELYELE